MITTLFVCVSLVSTADADDRQTVLVVVGAPGTREYGEQFAPWAARWEEAAKKANAGFVPIGTTVDEGATDRDLLRQAIQAEKVATGETLWIVLIGHGTFDGQTARFNLRGPDVTAHELAEWLKDLPRPTAIVNCASSSGPFINRLSGPDRVVVTAAKSGYEYNYARFGDYLSQAIASTEADLDKDEQTSLLEAFLVASARVAEFYEQEARLATEHSLIDDNGDALGTPATWFRGVRATRSAEGGASPDGFRANQFHLVRSHRDRAMSAAARTRRDELERQIDQLRQSKQELSEDDYYDRLETLLLQLARLYEELDQGSKPAEQSQE